MILWKPCYELPRTCSWWEGIGGAVTVVHPDGKAKSMTSEEFAVHYVSRRPAPGEIRDELQAREAEIERLRARVAVLETALRYYADEQFNGYNGNGDCARAALEDRPCPR